jgi:hypothetical protein
MMGPALREGYWQPENYKDKGTMYIETFSSISNNQSSGLATIYFDNNKIFKENLKGSYISGISGEKIGYPYIKLTPEMISKIKTKADSVSF